jgi:hypothetical protein
MQNRSKLYDLGDRFILGLTQYEAVLGVSHVTQATLEPVLLDAKAKSLAYDTARNGKALAYEALRAKRSEVDAFLLAARNHLIGWLGNNWSVAWVALGFNDSLTLPNADTRRQQILERFKAHLTAARERENAANQVTAAKAEQFHAELREALAQVTDCKRAARDKRLARDAAEAELEKKLFCLRKELEALLAPLDTRWLVFLDRIPGDPRVPEPVEDFSGTPQPGGIIKLDWSDAARATRYWVLKQVVGTDPDFVLADTVERSEAQLTGVPRGATVKLQVVPVNGVGEGAPSEVIELQAA